MTNPCTVHSEGHMEIYFVCPERPQAVSSDAVSAHPLLAFSHSLALFPPASSSVPFIKCAEGVHCSKKDTSMQISVPRAITFCSGREGSAWGALQGSGASPRTAPGQLQGPGATPEQLRDGSRALRQLRSSSGAAPKRLRSTSRVARGPWGSSVTVSGSSLWP